MKIARIVLGLLLLAAIGFGCASCSESKAFQQKEPVIFIGGGTIDDHVASVLMFTMENIDYRGNIITNSDSIYSFAMQNQWRIQSYLGATTYPVTLSEARGWNPFPMEYREDSIKVYNSDILKGYPDNPAWPGNYIWGEQFLEGNYSVPSA